MISHEHRVIFVHIPKAAGTSVESTLGHYGERGMVRGVQDHRTLRQLQWPAGGVRQVSSLANGGEVARAIKARLRRDEHHANGLTVTRAQYAAYLKFGIVRNPWARAYSWYRNVVNDPLHRARYRVPADLSLPAFLDRHDGTGLLRPQPYWLLDFAGRIGVDVICRFESLEQDFARVCERVGLPVLALPRLNPGDESDYLDRFDNRSRALIADRHRDEIELFGYTFDT